MSAALPPAAGTATALDAAILLRFRHALSEHVGLVFPEYRVDMLADLLQERAKVHGLDPRAYVFALERGGRSSELDALAPYVTTGETYFFRNSAQFDVLREQVLPGLLHERRLAGRGVSILSAGCSTGEELYTVAMLMQEMAPGDRPEVHSLLGVDLNPRALQAAREGRYTAWSLRETPIEAKERWFESTAQEYRVHAALRAAVRFEQLNLHARAPEFWTPERFDVIFARNVLMYFDRDGMAAALARMAAALAPGGYLFLGHSENLRELVQDWQVCHTHGTFYYRRQATTDAVAPQDWLADIHRAADRVRGLTEAPAVRQAVPPLAPARDGFEGALVHFSQERFDAAAQALDALPAASARMADAQLLRAMLHVHHGELQRAEHIAHALLVREPRCAAAHYVIGLCREGSGDLGAAANRYRLADGFALSHLQLGRLARRRGDRQTKRQELDRAAALLAYERPQHVQMFGGGFDRQALLALCRSEGARE